MTAYTVNKICIHVAEKGAENSQLLDRHLQCYPHVEWRCFITKDEGEKGYWDVSRSEAQIDVHMNV